MVLVAKYGQEARSSEFYSEIVYGAFGHKYATKGEHNVLYNARFFEYFMDWFGFIQLESIRGQYNNYLVTKTALFDKIFEINK